MKAKDYMKSRPGEPVYGIWLDVLRYIVVIGCCCGAVIGSTQSFARGLGYNQAYVGRPLISFAGMNIYNPAYFFTSIPKYIWIEDVQRLYIKAFSWYVWFGIALLIFSIAWSLYGTFIRRNAKGVYGTAKMANTSDLKKRGLLKKKGMPLGMLASAKVDPNFSEDTSLRMKLIRPARLICQKGTVNTLLEAPTGAGKGVGIIIPVHFSYDESIVSFDPKEENFNTTAGWRATFSHVLKFAPCSYITHRFNPVDAIRDGDEYAYRDASELAAVIVPQTKKGGGGDAAAEYFASMARDLITGGLLHIRFSDYEDKTLAGLLHFLTENGGQNNVGEQAESKPGEIPCGMMMSHDHRHFFRISEQMYKNQPEYYQNLVFCGKKGSELLEYDADGNIINNGIIGQEIAAPDIDKKCFGIAAASMNQNEKERASTYATVRSYLALFNDPMIANATSRSDFVIEDFISSDIPISLYLCVPYSDIERIAPVFRIIISFMLAKFSEGTTSFGKVRLRHDVLFILDEFPVLGYMPGIAANMGVLRGYGVHFLIVCQSKNQLVDRYGQNHPFDDHCPIQVVYAPGDIKDAENYSRSIGQESVSMQKVSRSGRLQLFNGKNLNFSEQDFGRNLLDAADIKRLPGDKLLLMVHGMQPYIGVKIVWYMDRRFKYKANYIAPKTQTDLYAQAADLPSVIAAKERFQRRLEAEKKLYEEDRRRNAEYFYSAVEFCPDVMNKEDADALFDDTEFDFRGAADDVEKAFSNDRPDPGVSTEPFDIDSFIDTYEPVPDDAGVTGEYDGGSSYFGGKDKERPDAFEGGM